MSSDARPYRLDEQEQWYCVVGPTLHQFGPWDKDAASVARASSLCNTLNAAYAAGQASALAARKGQEAEPCARCDGSGSVSADGAAHYQSEWMRGTVPVHPCPQCNGTGKAALAARKGQEIKPLVWEKRDPSLRGSHASTVVGEYRVWPCPGHDLWAMSTPEGSEIVKDESTAKDKCEDHYRTKIGSALAARIQP